MSLCYAGGAVLTSRFKHKLTLYEQASRDLGRLSRESDCGYAQGTLLPPEIGAPGNGLPILAKALQPIGHVSETASESPDRAAQK